MGLIKAAVGALSGTLADTWKEAIHCPVIGNDTVVVNGEKMHNGNARSSNTKGTDNVISNGSAIMVEENTCMLTLDNGKITNVVTEPGRTYLTTRQHLQSLQVRSRIRSRILFQDSHTAEHPPPSRE